MSEVTEEQPDAPVPAAEPKAPVETLIHAGLLRVSLAALPSILRMPEGAEVSSAHVDSRYTDDVICLRVTHPSLPAHRPGDLLAEIDLEMHEPLGLRRDSEFK